MDRQDKVQWVYSARNTQELAERYDQWAEDYEQDLEEVFGYTGPRRAVEYFGGHVPKEARVLDAGAGTGLAGELLYRNGYHNLVAIDLSRGMLEEAERKNVYTELHQMDMTQPLDFPTDSFDAVLCVGVFTIGHATASSFDELVRVTRPSGHIVFTLRADLYESGGFSEKQKDLETAGRWELLEVSEEFQSLPKGEPEVSMQVWVYRVRGKRASEPLRRDF